MLKAYYEALKPERTYANVMMTLAGFLFASAWHLNWLLLFYTIIGTTLIVMSACAANNLTDRGIDARMSRTKKRATVTGEVSPGRLLAIAIVFGLVGIAILLLHVNWLTALLGAIGYIDYVVFYAWTKRTTIHSTLVGTIAGAVPLVAGYTAVIGRFDLTALLLGLVMVFWQMPHFYAISIFRLKDYKAGGLPVWPVKKGVRSTQVWMIAYTVLYVLSVVSLTVFGTASASFAAAMAVLGVYWLYQGVNGFQSEQPEKWARGMFGFSLITLLALAGILAVSPLLP
ncbi:MAG TPA: heme o synthase [Candidatus Saccharimonadales bacterium]|nr:heme o synthase [Candidatus Saccharimonadales bacterium]